jgi:rhodanese-related sulfurtransferase
MCVGAADYRTRRIDVSTRNSGGGVGAAALGTLDRMDGDYTPQQVATLLRESDIQLIDVREPDEHEAGRIAGDRLVPLMELSAQADSLTRSRPLVFYCRTGSRSAMATEAFRGAGFDAHNMAGGLVEWDAAGLPLEPADGRVV